MTSKMENDDSDLIDEDPPQGGIWVWRDDGLWECWGCVGGRVLPIKSRPGRFCIGCGEMPPGRKGRYDGETVQDRHGCNDYHVTDSLNLRLGDNRRNRSLHHEWHAPCGCAFHPDPFPHVHPCSGEHKRADLHEPRPYPGYRLLECNQCPALWISWNRDYRSELGEPCPKCNISHFGYGRARPLNQYELIRVTESGWMSNKIVITDTREWDRVINEIP